MNRRELLLGTAGAVVASALPAIVVNVGDGWRDWTRDKLEHGGWPAYEPAKAEPIYTINPTASPLASMA